MRIWLGGAVLAGLAAGAPSFEQASAATFTAHRDHVLGTSFDFATSGDEEGGIAATAAALAEIARLDIVLSGWRDDSELAALNGAARFEASQELFALIVYGERLMARTNGVFSPRLGLLTRRGAVRENSKRLAATIAAAPVKLDVARRVIERPPEVVFDLDAFAKGHIIDRALAAAKVAAPDAKGMLLNIGGDIAAFGVADDGRPWRASVAAPGDSDNANAARQITLNNAALAMSGSGARDVAELSGAQRSHLLHGREGLSASYSAGAAVLAPSAMEADALATTYALMTRAEALSDADAADVGAHLFGAAHTSNDAWRRAEAPAACQAVAPLPAGYGVSVSFDIPEMAVGNYEKPYVSIWISDANRQLIRVLLVLGDRARWREENYVWWRRYERMDVPSIQAIARPSRAPGHYSVTWDGRDQVGAVVPQGIYTLNIEVAREHGSHTIKAIPLTLGASALDAATDAQGELGAVSAHYGPAR